MKKLFTVYLLLLAGMVQGQDLFQGTLFPAELIMKNRDTISLTDQQAEKIKTIHGKNSGEFSTLRWDLDAENEKLKKMLQEPKINSEAAQKQMDKILNLENQLKKKQFSNLLAIRSELNESQATSLAKMNVSKTVSGFAVSRDQSFGSIISNGVVVDKNDNKVASVVLRSTNGISGDYLPLTIIKKGAKDQIVKDMSSIEPNSIDAIEVLKGSKAISEYGDLGKNGVIIITLKKDKNPDLEK